MRKWGIAASLIIIVVFYLHAAGGQILEQFNGAKTRLVFCDVGEGDGAILITPQNVFLIDAGRDRRMTKCLDRHLPMWRREITGVILTHPDADHMNGLFSVIKSYRVKHLFSNFTPNAKGDYHNLIDALRTKKVDIRSFVNGDQIRIKTSEDSENSEHQEIRNSEKSEIQKNTNNFSFRNSGSLISLTLRPAEFSEFSGISIVSLWPLNPKHSDLYDTNLFSTVSIVTIGESKFLMLADAEIAAQINLLPRLINFGKTESQNQKNSDISVNPLEIRVNPMTDKPTTDKPDSDNRPASPKLSPRRSLWRSTGQRGEQLKTDNREFTAIKLSHHGSSKNFSYTLLRELSPQYAIISVGKNSYGHPGKKVLEMIGELGIQILRTDEQKESSSGGDIVFKCQPQCELESF